MPHGRAFIKGPRTIAAAILVAAGVLSVPSCLSATAVSIEARTDVPARDNLNVTITVGAPGQTENAEPTTETGGWSTDGFVGTLTVIPPEDKDARLSVKVVLGVRRTARDCAPPEYAGCIVARRKLRYLENETLRLPVVLYARCEGVPCDESSTCNALGACVPADVDPEKCGSAEGCIIPGDPPPGSAPDASGGQDSGGNSSTDTGVPTSFDAASSNDGGSGSGADGSTTEAGQDDDAGRDGGLNPGDKDGSTEPDSGGPTSQDGGMESDGGIGPPPGNLDCRTVSCSTGDGEKCCYHTGSQTGSCSGQALSCPASSQNHSFACTTSSHCGIGYCCYNAGSRASTCSAVSCTSSGDLEMCQDGLCKNGQCTAQPLHSYFPMCTQ